MRFYTLILLFSFFFLAWTDAIKGVKGGSLLLVEDNSVNCTANCSPGDDNRGSGRKS